MFSGSIYAEESQVPQVLNNENALSAEKEDINAILVRLYAECTRHLSTFNSIITHMAQLNNAGKLNGKNREEIKLFLQQMTSVSSEVKKISAGALSFKSVMEFASATHMLVDYLNNAIDQNFDQLPELSAEHLLKRYIPDEILPDTVMECVTDLETHVKNLEKLANKSGLHWYNRAYTTLLRTNKNYHISSSLKSTFYGTAALAAAGLVAGGFIRYQFFPEYDEQVRRLGYSLDKTKLETDFKAALVQANDHTRLKLFDWYQYLNNNFSFNTLCSVYFGLASLSITASHATTGINNLIAINEKVGLIKKIKRKFAELDAFLRGTELKVDDGVQYTSSNLTLDDPQFAGIPGLDVFDTILNYLEDPWLFIRTGMRVPKAILLTGNSGNGKSYVAKAFWGSVNKRLGNKFKFIQIEQVELQNYMGMSNADYIMARARQHAPCVVYIDELHLAGLQVEKNSKLLAELLPMLDEIDNNDDPENQIIIIAATNRHDLLDPALTRPGRLGTRIHFENPTFEMRKLMFETACKVDAVDITGIDFDYLAHITEGCSRAMIKKVYELAAFTAKSRNEPLSFDHLYQAIQILVRRVTSAISLSPQEKHLIANYQSGVALAHALLDSGEVLESVTIEAQSRAIVEKYDYQVKFEQKKKKKSNVKYGAVYTWHKNEALGAESYELKKVRCKLLLAGSVAQKILLGSASSYRSKDRKRALDLVQQILLNGLKFEDLSEAKRDALKDQALNLLNEWEQELYILFEQHKQDLESVVTLLEEQRTIRAQELYNLLKK